MIKYNKSISTANAVDNVIIYIEALRDLIKLAGSNYHDTMFKLKRDIDLEEDKTWHEFVIDFANDRNPLNSLSMKGNIFDGGGYAIKNLKINRLSENVGFFSENALAVRNLTFETLEK